MKIKSNLLGLLLVIGISACTKPTEACFTYSPIMRIDVSTPVVFDASCTLNGGYSYRWDFGDGSPDTLLLGQAVVTHQYDTSGVFTVTMTAGRRDGVVWSESDKMTVQQMIVVQ